MDLGIGGRNALLTASSRGLGRACAMALAGEGVNVTINGLSEENLARTANEIRTATASEVVTVVADINTTEGRRRLLEACPDPDILVNNNWGPLVDGRNSNTKIGCRQWSRTCWLRS